MANLCLSGQVTKLQAAPCPRVRQAQRRPLRQLCALSLERGSDGAGRQSPVRGPTAPAAAALVVDSRTSDDAQVSAYDAGYQAGLAAARQAQAESDSRPAQPVHDSMLRSIVKAFSWRFFSTATTIVLTMSFFNATLEDALEMGAAEFVSKYILFLIHERLWILVTLV